MLLFFLFVGCFFFCDWCSRELLDARLHFSSFVRIPSVVWWIACIRIRERGNWCSFFLQFKVICIRFVLFYFKMPFIIYGVDFSSTRTKNRIIISWSVVVGKYVCELTFILAKHCLIITSLWAYHGMLYNDIIAEIA